MTTPQPETDPRLPEPVQSGSAAETVAVAADAPDPEPQREPSAVDATPDLTGETPGEEASGSNLLPGTGGGTAVPVTPESAGTGAAASTGGDPARPVAPGDVAPVVWAARMVRAAIPDATRLTFGLTGVGAVLREVHNSDGHVRWTTTPRIGKSPGPRLDRDQVNAYLDRAYLDGDLVEAVGYHRYAVDIDRVVAAPVPDPGEWGPDNVQAGDLVYVVSTRRGPQRVARGQWWEVVRVNRKSVALKNDRGAATTVRWDRVGGLRRHGGHYDTPASQPLVADVVEKADQWRQFRGRSSGDRGRDTQEWLAQLRQAQQLVFGLPDDTSAAEVAAYPDLPDAATRLELLARHLDVVVRLTAGDPVEEIRASLPAYPAQPAWRFPTDVEPVTRAAQDLEPGDLVRGVWEPGRDGLVLDTYLGGHVTEVKHLDRGPRARAKLVGWVEVTTAEDGATHTIPVGERLAVYPAGMTASHDTTAVVPTPQREELGSGPRDSVPAAGESGPDAGAADATGSGRSEQADGELVGAVSEGATANPAGLAAADTPEQPAIPAEPVEQAAATAPETGSTLVTGRDVPAADVVAVDYLPDPTRRERLLREVGETAALYEALEAGEAARLFREAYSAAAWVAVSTDRDGTAVVDTVCDRRGDPLSTDVDTSAAVGHLRQALMAADWATAGAAHQYRFDIDIALRYRDVLVDGGGWQRVPADELLREARSAVSRYGTLQAAEACRLIREAVPDAVAVEFTMRPPPSGAVLRYVNDDKGTPLRRWRPDGSIARRGRAAGPDLDQRDAIQQLLYRAIRHGPDLHADRHEDLTGVSYVLDIDEVFDVGRQAATEHEQLVGRRDTAAPATPGGDPLARFTTVEWAVIEEAVRDHAAGYYRLPGSAPSRYNAVRYVTEGHLKQLDHHPSNQVWEAVEAVIAANPDVLDWTEQDRATERSQRERDAERLLRDESVDAFEHGRYERARRLLDLAQLLAPSYIARQRAWNLAHTVISDRRASAVAQAVLPGEDPADLSRIRDTVADHAHRYATFDRPAGDVARLVTAVHLGDLAGEYGADVVAAVATAQIETHPEVLTRQPWEEVTAGQDERAAGRPAPAPPQRDTAQDSPTVGASPAAEEDGASPSHAGDGGETPPAPDPAAEVEEESVTDSGTDASPAARAPAPQQVAAPPEQPAGVVADAPAPAPSEAGDAPEEETSRDAVPTTVAPEQTEPKDPSGSPDPSPPAVDQRHAAMGGRGRRISPAKVERLARRAFDAFEVGRFGLARRIIDEAEQVTPPGYLVAGRRSWDSIRDLIAAREARVAAGGELPGGDLVDLAWIRVAVGVHAHAHAAQGRPVLDVAQAVAQEPVLKRLVGKYGAVVVAAVVSARIDAEPTVLRRPDPEVRRTEANRLGRLATTARDGGDFRLALHLLTAAVNICPGLAQERGTTWEAVIAPIAALARGDTAGGDRAARRGGNTIAGRGPTRPADPQRRDLER